MLKVEQIAPIDQHWAVRESFALMALEVMQGLTVEAAGEAAKGGGNRRAEVGDSPGYDKVGSVAVVGLSGPMTKKPTSVNWLFGGTSTVELRSALRAAVGDDEVEQILLVIDSPGGQAQGTSDLVDEIRGAALRKPVTGYVDGLAASAAYWAACGCDAIYGSRTSEVGCIGTFMTVTDSSKAYANRGLDVHVIRAGKFKGMGTPGTPVTAEQLDVLQQEVDAINNHFVADVAVGRGLDLDAAMELADGRVYIAQAAVDAGLLDGICSLDECLATISSSLGAGGYGNKSQKGELHMAENEKPSPGARLMAFLRGEGTSGLPGSGLEVGRMRGVGQVSLGQLIEQQAEAQATSAALLVQATCGHLAPAQRPGLMSLAAAALIYDGGSQGEACDAFASLAKASVPDMDMTRSQFVQLASNPPDQEGLAVQAERVRTSAVRAMNGGRK
jgi:signal peptide peptidase SppA